MWEYVHTDELYHYGVLGMKWGKRKAAQYEARANRLDAKIQRKIDKKKILRVSDGNKIAAVANLRSRAKDLSSNKKVSMKEMNNHSRKAKVEAIREAKQHNKNIRAEAIEKERAHNLEEVKSRKYGKSDYQIYGEMMVKNIGTWGVTSLASSVATKMGKHTAAEIINAAGSVSMLVNSVSSTYKILTNTKKKNKGGQK